MLSGTPPPELAKQCARVRTRRQDADGRTLVRLPDVAVEGFDVETELPEVRRLEALHLQLERDKALETAMKEDKVDGEVLAADLHRGLRTHEANSRL